MLKPVLLLALLLLAGCAGTRAPPPATTDAPSLPTLLPQNPAFQDCTVGITLFSFPKGTAPGTVPPEWEPSPGAGSDVRVELLDCAKVAWGPFERGPVQFMVELHTKGKVPENCTFERPDFLYNLERILVSDADLAHYVHAAYGIAAEAGTIHVASSQRTDQFTDYHWSWSVAGQPASTLTVGDSDTLLPTTTRAVERWFWANGTGLGVLDVSRSYVAGAESYVAAGEMHHPMLYAQAVPQGTYVGLGDAGTSYQATSTYHQFEDQRCERPLSS